MNNKRRKEIKFIQKFLIAEELAEDILNRLEDVLCDEENSYYNIPENLLGSVRAEESENAIDCLDEAIDLLSKYVDKDNPSLIWRNVSDKIKRLLDDIIKGGKYV